MFEGANIEIIDVNIKGAMSGVRMIGRNGGVITCTWVGSNHVAVTVVFVRGQGDDRERLGVSVQFGRCGAGMCAFARGIRWFWRERRRPFMCWSRTRTWA